MVHLVLVSLWIEPLTRRIKLLPWQRVIKLTCQRPQVASSCHANTISITQSHASNLIMWYSGDVSARMWINKRTHLWVVDRPSNQNVGSVIQSQRVLNTCSYSSRDLQSMSSNFNRIWCISEPIKPDILFAAWFMLQSNAVLFLCNVFSRAIVI